jgi:hypothetical protein
MEHEFSFLAALSPSDRQLLRVVADAVVWDIETLAIVIKPKDRYCRKVIDYHFSRIIRYPLPWPHRVGAIKP